MNKAELIDAVASKTTLNKSESTKAVEAVLTSIRSAVQAGKEVRLQHFGAFQPVTRKAKTGRNPQTGAEIQIPEKKVVKFKPSSNFLD